ncbi:hypothetical protein WEI85_38030 [Actinomycetes bacterium KLBMP 9797]
MLRRAVGRDQKQPPTVVGKYDLVFETTRQAGHMHEFIATRVQRQHSRDAFDR